MIFQKFGFSIRIVDETFDIDSFLQQINSKYSSIEFTHEKEVYMKLPSLVN